ncbi:hypothetical protein CDL15_Pgr020830 [Punica granatum]|uniref:Gnk2-homologous domain-containing protein n=1 Tax=Punica granatum TaxID=22663 RepID=A0A218XW53_PUNGR|nr:hypothetical protein CDL15_Pgr020830 [Punica granatum]
MIRGDPNTDELDWSCNAEEMDPNGPDPHVVSDLLQFIYSQTPDSGDNFYAEAEAPTRVYYGRAACNGELSHEDCKKCLEDCYYRVFHHCKYKMGGQVKLEDCRMRYEDYPFSDE